MSGRWSEWRRDHFYFCRVWTDGATSVEVRVFVPVDGLPLIPPIHCWRWEVRVDGKSVKAGEIPASTPAPRLFAPFWAMQAGRATVAELQLRAAGV
jgi:hypothetical protein